MLFDDEGPVGYTESPDDVRAVSDPEEIEDSEETMVLYVEEVLSHSLEVSGPDELGTLYDTVELLP